MAACDALDMKTLCNPPRDPRFVWNNEKYMVNFKISFFHLQRNGQQQKEMRALRVTAWPCCTEEEFISCCHFLSMSFLLCKAWSCVHRPPWQTILLVHKHTHTHAHTHTRAHTDIHRNVNVTHWSEYLKSETDTHKLYFYVSHFLSHIHTHM